MSFLLATADTEVLPVAPFFLSDACICTQVLGKHQDRGAGHPLQPCGNTVCALLMCSTSTRSQRGAGPGPVPFSAFEFPKQGAIWFSSLQSPVQERAHFVRLVALREMVRREWQFEAAGGEANIKLFFLIWDLFQFRSVSWALLKCDSTRFPTFLYHINHFWQMPDPKWEQRILHRSLQVPKITELSQSKQSNDCPCCSLGWFWDAVLVLVPTPPGFWRCHDRGWEGPFSFAAVYPVLANGEPF